MFRRETMIALRARRTALGIARDVVYPPLSVPKPLPPPVTAISAPDPQEPAPAPQRARLKKVEKRSSSDLVLWTLFTISMAYIVWWTMRYLVVIQDSM
jgi:hypothetical protein